MYNPLGPPGETITRPVRKAKIVETTGPDADDDCTTGLALSKRARRHRRSKAGSPRPRTIEILDLRSLPPYDGEAIASSVVKTNRSLSRTKITLVSDWGGKIAAKNCPMSCSRASMRLSAG